MESDLGGLLREQDSGIGLGWRDDFLDKNTIKQWKQTLCHLRNQTKTERPKF